MNPPVITLDEQTAATIREFASAEQRPETEIVRDALALYVQSGRRPRPIGVGQYRSGAQQVSEQARALIRDAVKEGRRRLPAIAEAEPPGQSVAVNQPGP